MQEKVMIKTPPGEGAAAVTQVHALTGVRIVAAMWVVLFHIRGNLASEFPELAELLGPVLAHGELGVDLFFALSGYVLALNYGDRMGLKLNRKATLKFWWARLARVWPAYAFMLVFTAVWHGVLLARHSADPVAVRDFSVASFLRQLSLVVQWTEPGFERLTWNGAAWSVSAEAFAYLLFPLMVLLVFRLNRSLSTRSMVIMVGILLFPVVFFSYVLGLYGAWMWLLRILCAFMAGALAFYIVRRIPSSGRNRLVASHVIVVATVLIIAGCFWIDRTGRSQYIGLLIPVLVLIVGALGMADRHIAKLLGTRPLVVGGMASYSIYLVHMPVIEIFWKMQMTFPESLGAGTPGAKLGFILLPAVVSGLGYCLWRFFEEPARRKMRLMSTQNIPERAVDDPAVDHQAHHAVGKRIP
ncbi:MULTISPECIES: acyltransferase [unclassified Arthrobacter]|uniref:acyltransferase family protein n=1 Tax=unclassified Arthrobacter TaxID=235627 RepID=UPI001C84B2C1|nr:acyltransferase [Arthrobacter sp. MAHUQ-56]MBX7445433.1 acyltransferase [Arthrobacter sp. MAHUQ-56]